MIKRFLTIIAVLSALIAKGQDATSSPYSYFGIGLPTFNGTAEYRSMEGLSILGSPNHLNLENPASFGALKLTTFTVGLTQRFTNVETQQDRERVRNTSFNYLAIGIPAGKLNFGFGFVPYSSVGYQFKEETDAFTSQFEGRGGLDKLFLTFGYHISDNLRVGVEGSYHFGNIHHKNMLQQAGIQYGTLEKDRSNLTGFQFKIGAQYAVKLHKDLLLNTSVSYAPAASLTSENFRNLSTILIGSAGNIAQINKIEVDLPDTQFDLPTDLRIGAGIGKPHKWFAGVEYENMGKTKYQTTSFATDNIEFKKANIFRIGGFYTPKYNDITNYFNRITLRAGLRYQETGMQVNGKDIDEFGISFGVGLPAGHYLSNIDLGIEYGQRGTTTAHLVKENFLNIFIGISLNDKWFREKKYH